MPSTIALKYYKILLFLRPHLLVVYFVPVVRATAIASASVTAGSDADHVLAGPPAPTLSVSFYCSLGYRRGHPKTSRVGAP